MNGVIKLGGTNFTMWKADLMFILAIMDIDDFFVKISMWSLKLKVIMTLLWHNAR
jgi:hypothetical protein